ncbi:hypothetical protein M0208_02850 [Sphingomonas sp. SUN019]|uniref:hypothetical protein n=1 Tax=Sphingomonas sp. SUN019 TaxID=2937788 RepID=UPI00216414DF|nr:hypothetical protein [Sphingomonas sp. SUN019]UVO49501.1 hypothetical protein M0208_02850 [Sphingomonas sp. SUN019]
MPTLQDNLDSMIRPRSILLFERLFLASLLLWCVLQAMTWDYRVALLATNAILATPAAAMATVVLAILAVSVAVWYFVARRSSRIAKRAAVALAVCSAITFIFGLIAIGQPGLPGPTIKLLSVAVSALCVAAAVPLFRPDAKTWFGEDTIGVTIE